ncbi:MAG: F0F1 ATP synthase subunit delta [Bacteroidales bacterium]|nr:F0F1 ATP synthase subunit delta [Bacteroidales bacterium]
MDQGLIPRRYAKALYEVASSRSLAQELYEHMRALEGAFAAEPQLSAAIKNPFVSDADKEALIVTASQAKPGDKMIDDLIRVLKENRRLDLVREIASAYQKVYREAQNIYRVKVIAAAPMGDAELDRLKKLIQSHLKGAKMEFSQEVDPDLIGGFVIDIDNERLDASVKNELKQLRLKLLNK